MPKMKTHSGAKKRIKRTSSGKLMREQTNNQHMFEGKSSRRKRKLDVPKQLSKADEKAAKRLLGLR